MCADPVAEALAKVNLGFRMPLPRRLAIPVHRSSAILRGIEIIVAGELELGARVACTCFGQEFATVRYVSLKEHILVPPAAATGHAAGQVSSLAARLWAAAPTTATRVRWPLVPGSWFLVP